MRNNSSESIVFSKRCILISHVVFGILALLYYLVKLLVRAVFGSSRTNRKLLRNAHLALDTLRRQYGGELQPAGRYGLLWQLHDGSSIEIRRRSHPSVHIHIPIEAQHPLSFQRIPRLVFAFLDSFLPENSRFGTAPYYIDSGGHNIGELKERPEFGRLFSRLSLEGYSMTLDSTGFKARKRLNRGDVSDIVLYEQLRLVRDFAILCARAAVIPLHAVNSTSRCAYCHEEAVDEIIQCAVCSTPHHRECFELNGRCSVFGCGSPRRTEEILLAH